MEHTPLRCMPCIESVTQLDRCRGDAAYTSSVPSVRVDTPAPHQTQQVQACPSTASGKAADGAPEGQHPEGLLEEDDDAIQGGDVKGSDDDDEPQWAIEPYISPERAGRLKREAESIWHKMTHLPKNPFCQICNECKAQRRQCRRGQGFGGPTPINFGDCVTMDHIIQRGEFSKSFLGHEEALLLFDRATGYMGCFPVLQKDALHTINSITEFRGLEYLHRVHTDGAKELKAACDQLEFFHTSSDAGNPKKMESLKSKSGF